MLHKSWTGAVQEDLGAVHSDVPPQGFPPLVYWRRHGRNGVHRGDCMFCAEGRNYIKGKHVKVPLVRNYDETLNNPRHFKWIFISGWEQHERLDLWVPAIPGGKTLLYPQPSVSISPMLPCYIKPFSQATIDDDDCFDAEEEDQDQD